jgi:hypothetical protein
LTLKLTIFLPAAAKSATLLIGDYSHVSQPIVNKEKTAE